ncbi:MAG TPA: hypothetical protein VIV12_16155, partial [Streptosporangiaceae bacterium]
MAGITLASGNVGPSGPVDAGAATAGATADISNAGPAAISRRAVLSASLRPNVVTGPGTALALETAFWRR